MASFSSPSSASATVIREALAALPPCASTHSILDFTGTYSFPPLLRKWYPHCKITVHVPDLQRAVALRVLHFGLGSGLYLDKRGGGGGGHRTAAAAPASTTTTATAASASKASKGSQIQAKEQYVRVQSRLHATRRSLVLKLLRVPEPAHSESSGMTNATADRKNVDCQASPPAAAAAAAAAASSSKGGGGGGGGGGGAGSAARQPAVEGTTTVSSSSSSSSFSSSSESGRKVESAASPTAFHRILATVSMRGYFHSGDRTVHNYCTGLLASLAAGGVCILFHDGESNTAVAEGYLGLTTHSDDVVDDSHGDADADAGTGGDSEPHTARTSSVVEWLFALEAVGFASVEICFQRGLSFVIAARAPSHESWDAWLAQEPAAHSRSFHAQRLTLGRRNALGERLTDWEAKIYETARPRQPKKTRPNAVPGSGYMESSSRTGGRVKAFLHPQLRFSSDRRKSGEKQQHHHHHSERGGVMASELRSSEMPVGFHLSPRDEMLDFSALFNGSVDEAMKAIEAGRVHIPSGGVYVCSAKLTRERGHEVFFRIYRSADKEGTLGELESNDAQQQQSGGGLVGSEGVMNDAAFVADRVAEIERSIQEAETARMIRAKIAKQMAENPEFAWGLEDSVISGGGANQETTSPNDSPSGMVEKARQAKDRLFSGLKNFTKRLSLNQGNEGELKHIGRSLKVFYGDCGVQRTDAELISIAQKFAGKRELLFTSMEKKYRDQGLYKHLWRLKENLFGDEVLTLAQAEELAERKQRQLQQQRQTHQLSQSVPSASSSSLPSSIPSGMGGRTLPSQGQDGGAPASSRASPRASGAFLSNPTARGNSDDGGLGATSDGDGGGSDDDDDDDDDDGHEVAVEVESDDDVGIAVDVDSDDESD